MTEFFDRFMTDADFFMDIVGGFTLGVVIALIYGTFITYMVKKG